MPGLKSATLQKIAFSRVCCGFMHSRQVNLREILAQSLYPVTINL